MKSTFLCLSGFCLSTSIISSSLIYNTQFVHSTTTNNKKCYKLSIQPNNREFNLIRVQQNETLKISKSNVAQWGFYDSSRNEIDVLTDDRVSITPDDQVQFDVEPGNYFLRYKKPLKVNDSIKICKGIKPKKV